MTQQPPAPMNHPGQWNPTQPAYGQHQPCVGQKSCLATWLLSWLLGVLGADHFYLGKIGTGILKLITLGGLGLWSLIDLIITLVGAQKDKHGLRLQGYDQHKKIAWIVTGIFFVLGLIIGGVAANSAPTPQPDDSSIVSEAEEAADAAPAAGAEAEPAREPLEAAPPAAEDPDEAE